MPQKNRVVETDEELDGLGERLEKLTNAQLDKHLERDGGVMMSDERFGVYQMEYQRRKLKMPQ